MITHIQGKLIEKNPTDVVIDCNGVGYMLNISLHTFSQIPDQEHLKLYTHLQVKEDSHTLFGFSSLAEREIFRLLISVSGVGASTARTMLSSLTPKQVREGIAVGDVALIQSIKGIGAKTAQRVILDLKDKILKVYDIDELSTPKNNTNKDEALSALDVLGFNKKQSERVVDKIISNQPDATVEVIIKQALKNL
ncbi:MAG: Holliday junction branch migration protein RuvA [Xanthomarina sp.]|jgi:Holliday junction DNA helicase RuvA|uniref:Holliday junction branch migration complex subunit RuvA n=1 Tax=Xanthomarina gelatinilytica TaxID=1137281 RepID=M7NCR0_9FLAO|nr:MULTISPECIES: Holliday junction branch migration protein RuvA [Xanthomarina]MCB0388039.1 Holliday junction branch migration protein RuvA [Winogradskyella sp.]EMQ96258.1 Holliday junction DNA helicase RuvA [Xanthomarina gelatinilytica]MAL23934.1 Holliday junction branch migration protein RuvA [Xanthomarina sp.]MBF61293.1 Holliday junction branch migration protein RuvA [Xanthomarina sp.]MDX1316490.1 Holliday junction branch migration protein RuvA [Xanthomarina gelatinilytica]|tara:strand:- start:1792 stop:2373 length:582 start_codon:yes stop_codon:yes gene_type:complete